MQKVNILAFKYFDNITIDLIYGVPNMSKKKWLANLEMAFEFGAGYRSETYSLFCSFIGLRRAINSNDNFFPECQHVVPSWLPVKRYGLKRNFDRLRFEFARLRATAAVINRKRAWAWVKWVNLQPVHV